MSLSYEAENIIIILLKLVLLTEMLMLRIKKFLNMYIHILILVFQTIVCKKKYTYNII